MSDSNVKLVLASASPRRLGLLEQAGLTPDLLNPVDLDETQRRRETPRALSLRLATEKAKAALEAPMVKALGSPPFVVAADTVVAAGRRVIGKPENVSQAADALSLLSGRSHKVFTSVCLITPGGNTRSRVVETRVRFKRLSRDEIESYLASDEWRGKAGGYAIQGRAGAFVRMLTGSYSAVVGLPLYETVSLLQGAGYPVYFSWMNAATEYA
ncbi:MAG: Maf family nucleotide pyrophosphatase [Aestuariivirgaceae bacterium]